MSERGGDGGEEKRVIGLVFLVFIFHRPNAAPICGIIIGGTVCGAGSF